MTYALLNLLFLVGVLVVALLLTRSAGVGGRWWLTVAVVVAALVVLTVVFDSIMIWADLFRFDEDLLTGVSLWLAPVEDLAWPLAAGLLLPALWTWLGRRGTARSHHAARGDSQVGANHEERP